MNLLKKIIPLLALSLTSSSIYAISPQHLNLSINLTGTYQCAISDKGHATGHAVVKYIFDSKNSNLSQGYSTYSFEGGFLQNGSYIYNGKAIVKNNMMAQHFQSKTDPNDNGVQLITITYKTAQNGTIIPTLHKFGYQAPYSAGNAIFSIDCIRISTS